MSNITGSLTPPPAGPRIVPVVVLPRFLSRTRYRSAMITYISQNAFWGLLISAVEVYKRECFGLLIGYRDRKGPQEMYIVEHALPYQTARRRHRGVASNPRAHKRIERFR